MNSELLWALGLFAGVIVTAALVNRFAVAHRSRVRRIVILYVAYVVALGASFVLRALGMHATADYVFAVTEILQVFSVVNIGATAIFSLLLPAAGIAVPMIANDLLIGIGYLFAIAGVLSHHGLDPRSILGASAVVSAVLALSLQTTLGNILGGIALQLDGSIHEGDWIQLENGKQGRVKSVRWRHTVVETRDWSTILVPNALLLGNNITILGKRDGRNVPQRMWVWFNVDFRYPPSKVIEVVTSAFTDVEMPGVAPDPPPNVVCMDFMKDARESYATYAVRYWLTDLASDDPTNSHIRSRVFTALRRASIPLAIPAQRAFITVESEERKSLKSVRHERERLDALRTVHLFRSLTEAELRTLAGGLSHVIYTNGETITRQGAVAHWLYVMTKGSTEVRVAQDGSGEGASKIVATLKAPDFFGEMGLMTGEPRSADVIATSDVDCFRLGKETFQRVLSNRPEMANELSEILATRRIELLSVRDGLDASARSARHASERARILGGIKEFFGL
ncbi:MAG: mechanosensitive ion channel family protein [Polyangiaceae bacterium]|nr:mechanosensitive ion channel family protein [Polyangiaceae bacterium]